MFISIDRRSWPFARILIILIVVFWFLSKPFSIAAGFALMLHLAFFRDPRRILPAGDQPISPADGKVVEISDVFEDQYLKEETVRIRIFLSLFVPHVNRIPIDGKIQYLKYEPGEFINALNKECFSKNESNWIGIQSKDRCILIRQIAGAIARRIHCDIGMNDQVKRGQKFGIICYGSGAECYIPKRLFKATVQIGNNVKAGETVLGEWIL